MKALADALAKALAKYREDTPWDQLTERQRDRHRRLGELLALELLRDPTVLAQNCPPIAPVASRPILTREAAIEVSVAVPVTVGRGKIGALSPNTVIDIYNACTAQLEQTPCPQTTSSSTPPTEPSRPPPPM